MRLFQNSGLYPGYLPRLAELTRACSSFAEARDVFLADRFGASHFLQPVLESAPDAFFTNGDDILLQRRWGSEQGMPATATLEDILLAQIEHHRTEVFYNLDPMRYGSKFIHRLPGSVKASIAWRAAPSPGADFSAYSLVVCNFPSIIKNYEERGWKSAYFSPAYDPVMDEYAMRDERTIDLLFVGGYTRHHRHRAAMLEQVASLRDQHSVVYCLDRSRMTRLAESPFGYLFFLGEHRRPRSVQHVSHAPVFGRQLYEMLGRARIVLNGAIDMAGEERGNMRCFETLGCGALLLSDAGAYPKGMVDGQTMVTYDNLNQVTAKIQNLLADEPRRAEIAARGHTMIASCFDKGSQWQQFQQLVA